MYNSQETNMRIKKLAYEKGVEMSKLQEVCDLDKDRATQSEKSSEDMKVKDLYAIAEVLECSIDYLLCRTANPAELYQVSYPVNNVALDNDVSELVGLIMSLPLVERSKAIIYLNNLKNKAKNKSKIQTIAENEQSLRSIINSADESLISIETVIKNLEEEQALCDKEQALREEENRKFVERLIAHFEGDEGI